MVGFVELFLNNPLLLFFVIAMLFSFFNSGGNKKENEKRKTRAPQGSSPARDTRERDKAEDEINWRDIFNQEGSPFKMEQPSPAPTMQSEEPKRRPQETIDAASSDFDDVVYKGDPALQEQYERLKEKQSLADEQITDMSDSPIYRGEIAKNAPKKLEIDFTNVSTNQVTKGIIWSEILNKPKSKSS